MNRLAEFRGAVKKVISEYAQYKPSLGDIEVEMVLDEVHDHYELLYIGWEGRQRVHGTVIHIDIRDGKILIHHDGTSTGVAEDLVALGIPRAQMVLGWHEPTLRKSPAYAFG